MATDNQFTRPPMGHASEQSALDLLMAAHRSALLALDQTQKGDISAEATHQAWQLTLTAVRLFAQQFLALQSQEYGNEAPEPDSVPPEVTATEVLVTVTALLKLVHLDPFELGMWQALG